MGFNSVEILLNFNTFGFLREGCRLLKPGLIMRPDDQDDPEYESDLVSVSTLNEIAGGDYWQAIIDQYYETHDFKSAEEALSLAYSVKLKEHFRYVLNMPIKTKLTNIPKYRIIHGTSHPDGLILMADTMNRRWMEFKRQQQGGQHEMAFVWEMPDYNLSTQPIPPIETAIQECVSGRLELKSMLACVFDQTGIRYSRSDIIDCLKRLEASGNVSVERTPELTNTGRKRTAWDHDSKDYKVFINRSNQWQQNLL